MERGRETETDRQRACVRMVSVDGKQHVYNKGVIQVLIVWCKLLALFYDILPSTTAVFSYAIESRKLSAKEQFFVGAQSVASLLKTTQIKQGVSFIAANKVYTSANKTTTV